MIGTIKITLETICIACAYGCPYVFCLFLYFVFLIQNLVVQINIIGQLVILALCQCTVGVGQLSQICKFLTIMDEIRIILRTLAFCKGFGNRTVPYWWHRWVAMKCCCHCNIRCRHGKRPCEVILLAK